MIERCLGRRQLDPKKIQRELDAAHEAGRLPRVVVVCEESMTKLFTGAECDTAWIDEATHAKLSIRWPSAKDSETRAVAAYSLAQPSPAPANA